MIMNSKRNLPLRQKAEKSWYVSHKFQLTAGFGSVTEIVSFDGFNTCPDVVV